MDQIIEHITSNGAPPILEQPKQLNIQEQLDKTICLSLKFSSLGNSKQIASNAVQSDVDEDMLHVGKSLLQSDTFIEIKSIETSVKKYIKTRWVASPMFKNGIYLIPCSLVWEVVNRLHEFRNQRNALVQKFIEEYPVLKEVAATKLNSQFNPMDYPNINKVQNAFSMEWRILTFSTPGKLKQISEKIWQEEIDKAQKEVQESFDEAKMALRECMRELVCHMGESLEEKPDGSKKRFHETNITKFVDFLNTFKDRNIMGDSELEKLAEDSRNILSGVSAVAVRTNEQLRDQLHSKFEEMKTSLDTMLVDRPRRKFKVKEELAEEQ